MNRTIYHTCIIYHLQSFHIEFAFYMFCTPLAYFQLQIAPIFMKLIKYKVVRRGFRRRSDQPLSSHDIHCHSARLLQPDVPQRKAAVKTVKPQNQPEDMSHLLKLIMNTIRCKLGQIKPAQSSKTISSALDAPINPTRRPATLSMVRLFFDTLQEDTDTGPSTSVDQTLGQKQKNDELYEQMTEKQRKTTLQEFMKTIEAMAADWSRHLAEGRETTRPIPTVLQQNSDLSTERDESVEILPSSTSSLERDVEICDIENTIPKSPQVEDAPLRKYAAWSEVLGNMTTRKPKYMYKAPVVELERHQLPTEKHRLHRLESARSPAHCFRKAAEREPTDWGSNTHSHVADSCSQSAHSTVARAPKNRCKSAIEARHQVTWNSNRLSVTGARAVSARGKTQTAANCKEFEDVLPAAGNHFDILNQKERTFMLGTDAQPQQRPADEASVPKPMIVADLEKTAHKPSPKPAWNKKPDKEFVQTYMKPNDLFSEQSELVVFRRRLLKACADFDIRKESVTSSQAGLFTITTITINRK